MSFPLPSSPLHNMKKTVGVLEEDEVSQLWVSFCGYQHLLDLAFVASKRIVGAEHDLLASEQLDHKLDVLVRAEGRVGVHVVEPLGQFRESLDVARRGTAAMRCDEVNFRMSPCAFDQMGKVWQRSVFVWWEVFLASARRTATIGRTNSGQT